MYKYSKKFHLRVSAQQIRPLLQNCRLCQNLCIRFFCKFSKIVCFLVHFPTGNCTQPASSVVSTAGSTPLIDIPRHSWMALTGGNYTMSFGFCFYFWVFSLFLLFSSGVHVDPSHLRSANHRLLLFSFISVNLQFFDFRLLDDLAVQKTHLNTSVIHSTHTHTHPHTLKSIFCIAHITNEFDYFLFLIIFVFLLRSAGIFYGRFFVIAPHFSLYPRIHAHIQCFSSDTIVFSTISLRISLQPSFVLQMKERRSDIKKISIKSYVVT